MDPDWKRSGVLADRRKYFRSFFRSWHRNGLMNWNPPALLAPVAAGDNS
jgi:hypothetical protein